MSHATLAQQDAQYPFKNVWKIYSYEINCTYILLDFTGFVNSISSMLQKVYHCDVYMLPQQEKMHNIHI